MNGVRSFTLRMRGPVHLRSPVVDMVVLLLEREHRISLEKQGEARYVFRGRMLSSLSRSELFGIVTSGDVEITTVDNEVRFDVGISYLGYAFALFGVFMGGSAFVVSFLGAPPLIIVFSTIIALLLWVISTYTCTKRIESEFERLLEYSVGIARKGEGIDSGAD